MGQLSKAYNPKEVEPRIYNSWEQSGYFNPDKLAKKGKRRAKNYTIVIPPPNITGRLHMGHALNNTIQDILIRSRRMQGYKTLWIPGTDHAGIATQNVVEKELKKEGITRHGLGREEFVKRVWEWRKKYGDVILEQLKNLGASCDWSRTAFTMDAGYIEAVRHAFNHYYKKGLIYRGNRVINWCPRCSTSLSDLELEYKNEKGKLWYLRYPIQDSDSRAGTPLYITVATTRPETLLGDAAVAVNPKDKRYGSLIGKSLLLPIKERKIPVIADKAVESEFGTGAVKITPNHDLTDFEIAERHNLTGYQVIGENGKMTRDAGVICEGLTTLECRDRLLEELESQGLIEKIEEYNHRVSTCYRCGATAEPLLSRQWFLKMDGLAKVALQAVRKEKVVFHPKRWGKVYSDWLRHTRDWCISRQIWWGHQIPIWYCTDTKKNENHFISVGKPKTCLICKSCTPRQDEDVLDTWFSAALWPFATLGWPNVCTNKTGRCKAKTGSDLKQFSPTQVLSTDRGIINLWVGRMVFSSYEFLGIRPFQDVLIHATVLTREGKRMSKSLGTGIDPLELIEKYGADATRFGLIWQAMGAQDIRFAEEHFLAGKKFCNKLWNATRFALEQISNSKTKVQDQKLQFEIKNLSKEDRVIVRELNDMIQLTNSDIEKFRFGQALHRLYDFFWHTFCDTYIEYAKTKNDRRTRQILLYVLSSSLRLLHPFIPFITEELYEKLPIKNKTLLLVEEWPHPFRM